MSQMTASYPEKSTSSHGPGYYFGALHKIIIIIIRQALQEYMETRNLQLVTRGKKPGSELRENTGKNWGLDIKGFGR